MSNRRSSHAGFTLIEMIVVLVVLGMAMAAIFPAIGNMMRSGSRSAAVSQASSEAGIAARMFEQDVRRALGNRATGERTDVALNQATIPSLAANNLAYSDIRIASPVRLVINADVIPQNGGIEQVEWILRRNSPMCGEVQGTTNANWCLQRRVMNAGGGQLTSEIPVKGRGLYPANITTCAPTLPAIAVRVFCYEEALPRSGQYTLAGWTATCDSLWLNDGASPNRTERANNSTRITTQHNRVDVVTNTNTSISRLDRVVTINASMFAGGAFGRASERSYEHVSVSIRSRESEAYLEAIMCGTKGRWGQ